MLIDMGYRCHVQRLTFLLWIPALVYSYPQTQRAKETLSRAKRQELCPIPGDTDWLHRNKWCRNNQTYHCLDNGSLIVQGCYQRLECFAGARPVIEGSSVVCRECPPGTYQPKDQLPTDRTTASYCSEHTPCNLAYGKKECHAGTKSTDIGCTCDPDRGYSQINPGSKDCDCFTKNDFCRCDFTGCVNGSTQNAQGLCVPVATTSKSLEKTTLALTTTLSPEAPGKDDTNLLVVILVPVLLLVLIGIVTAVFVLRKKRRRGLQQRQSEGVNGESRHTENGHTNGKVSTFANGTEHSQQSRVFIPDSISYNIQSAGQVIFQNSTIAPHVEIKNTQQTVTQTGTNTVNYWDNAFPQVLDEHTSPYFPQAHPASTTTPSTIPMSSSAATGSVPDESVTYTPGDDTTITTVPSASGTGKSTQSRFARFVKDSFSVTQKGQNNTFNYNRGTRSNSKDRSSDEDEEHLNVQSPTAFPHGVQSSIAIPQGVQSSTCVPQSEEPGSTSTPPIIVPSGAPMPHSGDNAIVSTSTASCSNLTPEQCPLLSVQEPQSDPSAPPDETPYPEPSAPPQSMPYSVDAVDEGGEEEHIPLYSSEETEVKSVQQPQDEETAVKKPLLESGAYEDQAACDSSVRSKR